MTDLTKEKAEEIFAKFLSDPDSVRYSKQESHDIAIALGFLSGHKAGAKEVLESEEFKEVAETIRDIAENYEHDEDDHRYRTMCRMCEAKEALAALSKLKAEHLAPGTPEGGK